MSYRIRVAFIAETSEPDLQPTVVSAYDECTEDAWNGVPDFHLEAIEKAGGRANVRELDIQVPQSIVDALFATPEYRAPTHQVTPRGGATMSDSATVSEVLNQAADRIEAHGLWKFGNPAFPSRGATCALLSITDQAPSGHLRGSVIAQLLTSLGLEIASDEDVNEDRVVSWNDSDESGDAVAVATALRKAAAA